MIKHDSLIINYPQSTAYDEEYHECYGGGEDCKCCITVEGEGIADVASGLVFYGVEDANRPTENDVVVYVPDSSIKNFTRNPLEIKRSPLDCFWSTNLYVTIHAIMKIES